MHVEIFLAIMVLAVALLVAADFFRRASDGPHEPADKPVREAGSPGRGAFTPPSSAGLPGTPGTTRAPGSAVTAFEPARTSRPGSLRPGQASSTGTQKAAKAAGGPKGGWLVRTRLSLLAGASALAAAAATASAIRAVDVIGGPSYHSDVSSIRDGAIASALLAGVAVIAALAVGGWAAVLLIRSVLRPLDQLRTGAVELAEVRLPDALRSGGRGPLAVRSVGLSSSDEIGQIARAFDRVQAEVLGVTSDEAGLRGKLGEMFVELSTRSQTLVERQLRLIDELEQGEQDATRRASLLKMDRIATRMRRSSQNLLVLAGHELPGEWNRPVTLADVIRAAVSQIEDYERVALNAQPGISVSGPAVKDVVHLLAELAENAASLSPAGSPVDIAGRTLASGGVLVDVTDQGVGMHPEVMAEANRRLDSPPAMDFAVSRNMGLFVVGRLAARHGIKVRLQPATAGGLTALVWLPDSVASRPDGAAGPGDDHGGLPRGAHAAVRAGRAAGTGRDGAPSLDRGPSGRDTMAGSMWAAPVMEDVRTRPSPATGAYPAQPSAATVTADRYTWPDTGLQPRFHPHPPASAEPSAPSTPSAFSQSLGISSTSAFPSEGSPSAFTPPPAPAVRTQASSLPQRLVASPPPAPAQPAAAATDDADPGERRLPIYEAVESDWFGTRRRQASGNSASAPSASAPSASAPSASAPSASAPSASAPSASAPSAAATSAEPVSWTAPADPGWSAAQAAVKPVSSGTTSAGLPVRSPRANLVPGTLGAASADPGATGNAQPGQPPIPRSASAVRDRLSGFQRGTSQGRAALGQDGEDQAP